MQKSGPLLIASNHPNSFLDAILLAILFPRPVYALTRGDVFTNRPVSRILRSLNMLPIYRMSEGAGNLGHNYTTFAACQEIFRQDGVVLIFSEGGSTNEWHLRPLKKGTARLSLAAWREGIDLEILPVGINYSNFRKWGKTVHVHFGEGITRHLLEPLEPDNRQIARFNELLNGALEPLVYQFRQADREKRSGVFGQRSRAFRAILLLPALAGMAVHAPLYYAIHSLLHRRAQDHYDSIVVGLLFFGYPLYVMLLTGIALYASRSPDALVLLVVLPLLALAALRFKTT